MSAQSKIIRMPETPWLSDHAVAVGEIEFQGRTYRLGDNMPHDADAEQQLIGSILVAGEAGNSTRAMQQAHFLRHDAFYNTKHGLIWRAMCALNNRGDAVDFSSLKTLLENRTMKDGGPSALEWIGGESYLIKFSSYTATNTETYARRIERAAIRRQLQLSSLQLGTLASSHDVDLDELLNTLHQQVRSVSNRASRMADRDSVSVADAVDDWSERFEADLLNDAYQTGIKTGIKALDTATLGWRAKKLYLLAAPPGHGKTALLITTALAALKQGKRVLFLTLEMSQSELVERMICAESRVDYTRMQSRKLSPSEIERVRKAGMAIKRMQAADECIISRMRRPSMRDIQTRVDRNYLSPGVDIVFLDYVGTNKISTPAGESLDGFGLMSHVYSELEAMKEAYDIPFVVTTQMNRDRSRRKGRPEMTDLMFGSVGEFAADFIGFIYHPAEDKEAASLVDPTLAELVIRKNRSGPKTMANDNSVVPLLWQSEYVRFADWPGAIQSQDRDLDLL